jgi:PQQ-like domain
MEVMGVRNTAFPRIHAKSKLGTMKIVTLVIQTIRHLPRRRLPAYALLCAVIAATGPIAKGDWTHFRYDPAHHGVSPDETILSPATVANLTVKWRTNIGGGCFASASVVAGKLYTADTGSARGQLHALDSATGQVLWNFPSDALTGDHAWQTASSISE